VEAEDMVLLAIDDEPGWLIEVYFFTKYSVEEG
jgi:hypothetical protein